MTITDVFLDQKRVNVCEHTVKMAPCERFWKLPLWWLRNRKGGGDGGNIKWNLSEVNTRSVSRGQNKLIGEFFPLDTALVLTSYDVGLGGFGVTCSPWDPRFTGFKPGWGRWIFSGRKNPEHKSSGRDFKLGIPSLRFQAR